MAKTLRTGKTRKTPPPTKPAAPKRRGFYFDKTNGVRVVGVISAGNGTQFERVREELAGRSGRDFVRVSDADVIEYLVNVYRFGKTTTHADLKARGVFVNDVFLK